MYSLRRSGSGESKLTSVRFQVVLPMVRVKSPVTLLTGSRDSIETFSPGWAVTVMAWLKV